MNKNTTVFFSEHCSHCRNLKDWLKKNNILFTAINTKDPEVTKKLIERGVQSIPFTVIEDAKTGETTEIIGFQQTKFEKIFLH